MMKLRKLMATRNRYRKTCDMITEAEPAMIIENERKCIVDNLVATRWDYYKSDKLKTEE